MPSIRAARSSRSIGARARRASGRGDAAIAATADGPRVVPRQDVRLVRRDQREPLVGGDAPEERDELARGRVGAVQVLEDEDGGSPLAEPSEQAEQPLHGPRLAALGSAPRLQAPAPRRVETGRQPGQEPHDVGGRRAEEGVEVGVGHRVEQRTHGAHDRSVGLVGADRIRAGAQDRDRFVEAGEAADRLVEEPADADPGRTADEHGPRASVRGVLEDRREPRERVLATDELSRWCTDRA